MADEDSGITLVQIRTRPTQACPTGTTGLEVDLVKVMGTRATLVARVAGLLGINGAEANGAGTVMGTTGRGVEFLVAVVEALDDVCNVNRWCETHADSPCVRLAKRRD